MKIKLWSRRSAIVLSAAVLPPSVVLSTSPDLSAPTPAVRPVEAAVTVPPALETRKELVAVLVTAEFCLASRTPEFPGTVETMNRLLQERADQEGRHYVRMGIGIDWEPQKSLNILARYGDFDEIVVGRNWYNTGLMRYLWGEFSGQPKIPQVILLERTLLMKTGGVEVVEEVEIARKVGVPDIMNWVESGAPLP